MGEKVNWHCVYIYIYVFYKRMGLPKKEGIYLKWALKEMINHQICLCLFSKQNPCIRHIYICIHSNTFIFFKPVLSMNVQRSIIFHLWPPPLVAAMEGPCHTITTCHMPCRQHQRYSLWPPSPNGFAILGWSVDHMSLANMSREVYLKTISRYTDTYIHIYIYTYIHIYIYTYIHIYIYTYIHIYIYTYIHIYICIYI